MAHIIMENADKKIKLLIICFQLKIVDILLSFFYGPVFNSRIVVTLALNSWNHAWPTAI